MTILKFIEKTVGQVSGKTRYFSSVLTTGEGVVYSYGYHYPLARIIDGVAFVNNAGYSNSTAKHINWAFSACANVVGAMNVYGVPLSGGNSLTLAGIRLSAAAELSTMKYEMARKTRTNTQVYGHLERQALRMQDVLTEVRVLEAKRGLVAA